MYKDLIPVTISDQKTIMLSILEEVDKYCSQNEITYYLTYGTLLGAVRHKGFIPWDDDIDIVMNRNDYDRFCKSFNDERSDSFRLISIDNTKGYNSLFAKVCDTRTILMESIHNPIELGVYIDIFVNDYLSDDLKKAKSVVFENRRLFKIVNASKIADREGRAKYKQLILHFIRCVTRIIGVRKLLKRIEKQSMKYLHLSSSLYCGSVTSLYYGEKEITETKWWGKGMKLSFEGRQFNVPSDYHSVLQTFYGDYMKLPPPEQQVTHHTHEVYWRENHVI